SRWPLEDLETFRLADRGHICQRARLSMDGCSVEVFNVHPVAPFEIYRRRRRLLKFGIRRRTSSFRDDQIDCLIELTSDLKEPTIFLGDFNVAAGSRLYRRLLMRLRDAFGEVGSGLGHTFPRPTKGYSLPLPAP